MRDVDGIGAAPAWRGRRGSAAARQRRWAVLRAGFLALLALGAAWRVDAQEVGGTPGASPPLAVPLSDVPTRATAVTEWLRGIEDSLAARSSITTIEAAMPATLTSLAEQESATARMLATNPTIDSLRQLERMWIGFDSQFEKWAKALRARSSALERELAGLHQVAATWRLTASAARSARAPAAVIASIEGVEARVAATIKSVEERHAEILTLQETVAGCAARVEQQSDLIEQTRAAFMSSLGLRDNPPLWRWFRGDDAAAASSLARVIDQAQAQAAELWHYLQDRFLVPCLHLVAILLIGLQLAQARQRSRGWGEEDGEVGAVGRIFAVPYSAALLLGMFAALWIYPRAPRLLIDVVVALALVPAIRILRGFVPPPLHSTLYALGGFYVIDRVRSLLAVSPPLERVLFLLELVAAIALLVWLDASRRVAGLSSSRNDPQRRVALFTERALIAFFAVAVVAMCLGFARLGKLLGEGALSCVYLAMILYAAAQAVIGAWVYALRGRLLGSLNFAREYRWLLQRRGRRAITFAAGFFWVLLALRALGVFTPLASLLDRFLAARIPLGELNISPADLLLFAACVWGSFLLSRFLRFLLEEDVYPRFKLAQGVPYALSTLLHYGLILLGLLVAMGAAGFDLTRISLIAGALSVGIGFGLQTLVNNFVSGLILLFERPVKVGDSIELQGLSGVVRRIGIRSSTIRTWDGAEVIVPNGLLISESLTNWTLSDRTRRIDVDVGVEYGTDPGRVLAILKEVAAANDDVLRNPAPVALFQGFGDSSLNFRLRFWIGDFDRGLLMRSDLSVAVNDALAKAGITIPFPQRDLHVRSVDVDLPGMRSNSTDPAPRDDSPGDQAK